MSIPTPTASALKLRFKEFASQDDPTIEFAIEEASLHVDDSWPVDRASLAILYLSAHYLMVSISRAQSGTGQRIKSQAMDGMSFTYADEEKKPDPADFTTTPYGSRYLDLVNQSFPGVLLI